MSVRYSCLLFRFDVFLILLPLQQSLSAAGFVFLRGVLAIGRSRERADPSLPNGKRKHHPCHTVREQSRIRV